MKKFTLILALCIIGITIHAQKNSYNEVMLKTISSLENASDNDDYLNCANKFERIALADKSEWLPYYYGSYSYILMSLNEADLDKKDGILDKAQQLLDSAFAINNLESEIHTLQAFLYPGRILVDPMARGMMYVQKFFMSIETAKSLDPENPRSYFLLATTMLNMPPSMGGGPEVAKPLFLEAEEKFRAFKPKNSLWPNWGEEANQLELSKFNEN